MAVLASDYACLVAQALKCCDARVEVECKGKVVPFIVRKGLGKNIQKCAAQSMVEGIAGGKKSNTGSLGSQFHGVEQGLARRGREIVANSICAAQSAQQLVRGEDMVELLAGIEHVAGNFGATGIDVQGAFGMGLAKNGCLGHRVSGLEWDDCNEDWKWKFERCLLTDRVSVLEQGGKAGVRKKVYGRPVEVCEKNGKSRRLSGVGSSHQSSEILQGGFGKTCE